MVVILSILVRTPPQKKSSFRDDCYVKSYRERRQVPSHGKSPHDNSGQESLESKLFINFGYLVFVYHILVYFPSGNYTYHHYDHGGHRGFDHIGSWIYNYLCNQCLTPLTKVWTPLRRGVLDTTLCDKVCQWLATAGLWFSLGTPVSSLNKTDCHDITEILLKVVLNTINQPTIHYDHVYSIFL